MPRTLLRTVLLAALVAGIVLAALYRDRLDIAALDAWLTGLGGWAPAAFMSLYATATVLFLPGSVFALLGGALFGPVWGTAFNLIAATIGATASFAVARYLAQDWVARKSAGALKRLVAGVEEEGWRFVAFVRLVPLFPFNLTNYALGLTRIGLVPYALTSLVCMLPGAIAYTWLGHAGREAFEGDLAAIRYGLLALGLLAAIAFLPRLVRRLRAGAEAWIEPEEVARRLGAPAFAVLDVRNGDELAGPLGHIPGIVHVPLGDLGTRLHELDALRGSEIAVVCRTERRSADAARTLRSDGFGPVRTMRGGMEAWRKLGLAPVNGQNEERKAQ